MNAWDTNFLVRHLLEDDARQLEVVRKELDRATRVGERIWLAQLVLVETTWVLGAHLNKKDVFDTLDEVLKDDRFHVQESAQVMAALAHARTKGDFAEHLIAQNARAAGCKKTQTFDKGVGRFVDFEVF